MTDAGGVMDAARERVEETAARETGDTMSDDRCVPARVVEVAFRNKRTRKRRVEQIAIPVRWNRGPWLRAVRAQHQDETVRVLHWGSVGKAANPWEVALWIPPPIGAPA